MKPPDAAAEAVVWVWVMPTAGVPDPPPGLSTLLEPAERARADAFHFRADGHAYRCAHLLRRLALTHRVPEVAPGAWRFVADARGRPALAGDGPGGGVDVNLTHTRGLVAVTVAEGVVAGVDAEALDRRGLEPALADRVCTPEEGARLAARAGDGTVWRRTFVRFWVRKEAVAKAAGLGLAADPATIHVAGRPRPAFTAGAGAWSRAGPWALWDLPPEAGHALALAARPWPARARVVYRRVDGPALARLATRPVR